LENTFKIFKNFISKFPLSPIYTFEEFSHLILPRKDVVYSYVVENEDNEITDFISYFHIKDNNILIDEMMKSTYLYYYANSKNQLTDLVHDLLIFIQKVLFYLKNRKDTICFIV
jgi:glycylpeptide N-tetradecanoyltransferase